MSTNAVRINSIQWLRGIAASAVVLAHWASTADKHGIHVPGVTGHSMGGWGVDLFFVISGFIMMLLTGRNTGRLAQTLEFWKARVLRIAPLYWLITTVIVALAIARPGATTEYRFGAMHALASYLFVAMADARGNIEPVLRVGWTLNLEMYFYLVFGLLLLLPRRLLLPATALWAAGLFLLGCAIQFDTPFLLSATSPYILEFAAGVFLGHFHLSNRSLPNALAIALILAGGAALIAADVEGLGVHGSWRFGLPAAMILAGCVSLETTGLFGFEAKWPNRLGDWSYAIYLTHVPALAAFGKLSQALRLDAWLPWPALLALDLAFAFFVGFLTHVLVEKPIARRIARIRRAKQNAPETVACGACQAAGMVEARPRVEPG